MTPHKDLRVEPVSGQIRLQLLGNQVCIYVRNLSLTSVYSFLRASILPRSFGTNHSSPVCDLMGPGGKTITSQFKKYFLSFCRMREDQDQWQTYDCKGRLGNCTGL